LKIFLFGATKKGFKVLQKFVTCFLDDLGAVCSFKETFVRENYYDAIAELCHKNNVPFFEWKTLRSSLLPTIESMKITHIILVGWRFLLPTVINQYLDTKMIVYHDSLLPRFRGFAPLPTAIIRGEKEVGFSVLFAEDEMDTGDIIMQKRFFVDDDMYIGDVIEMIAQGYADSLGEFLELLRRGNVNGTPQDHSKATYSIWRDISDMEIDWNQDAITIYNFIRALGSPYLGAYTYMDNKKIIIERAKIVEDVAFEIRQPGKLWRISGGSAIVVCGSGMIEISECYYEDGTKVLFTNLRKRLGRTIL